MLQLRFLFSFINVLHTLYTLTKFNLIYCGETVSDSALEYDPPAFVRGKIADAEEANERVVLDLQDGTSTCTAQATDPDTEDADNIGGFYSLTAAGKKRRKEDDEDADEEEDEDEEGGIDGPQTQVTTIGGVKVAVPIPGQRKST
jgi:hypothetical protein